MVAIPFQKPYRLDKANRLVQTVLESGHTEGDGQMTALCLKHLRGLWQTDNILMTTSASQALELAVRLSGVGPGDEVIVPSFSHPSAANAVLLAGGTVVLGEVEPDHLLIDPRSVERHLTKRTKAVIVVHYGGISCDLDAMMKLATKYDLAVIEDCAQSFGTTYRGRPTGLWGQTGCFSFHGTKDVIAGEGGALVVNQDDLFRTAQIFHQKGTNRFDFTGGAVSRYEWQGIGTSCSPSELTMALLASQLEESATIVRKKQKLFQRYFTTLCSLPDQDRLLAGFSKPKDDCTENGHLFYLLFKEAGIARQLLNYLAASKIDARTHFVPLHESAFGQRFLRPDNDLKPETGLGARLVRLPLYALMTQKEQDLVIQAVKSFFQENKND